MVEEGAFFGQIIMSNLPLVDLENLAGQFIVDFFCLSFFRETTALGREHQQTTLVMLSRFWLLRRWECLSETMKKIKIGKKSNLS